MVRKDIFVTALIITVFVFLSGYYIGTYQDSFRISVSKDSLRTSELDTESFLAEKLFFETFGGGGCGPLVNRLESFNEQIYEIGQKLQGFDNMKLSKQKEFDYLKRQYFILEINTYIIKKQLHDSCNQTSNTILFFYDTLNNDMSIRQGLVLDSLQRQVNITILSFDINFDDPLLESLKDYYKIKNAPSLIINFETKKEEYVNVPGLMKMFK